MGYQQSNNPSFVIYYKENDKLNVITFAVISDRLKHDTTAIYCFISVVIPELKNSVIYFSDGAASQYKNYKNLVKICSMSMQNGTFMPPATGRVHVM